MTLGVVAVLLVAGVMISRLSSAAHSPAASGTDDGHLSAGTLLDKQVPDFRLIDDQGRRVSLADFRGRYLVLAPTMTLCHEVCPMTTAALHDIQTRLRRQGLGSKVSVAEATVDPWRDSPARLRAYRRMTGLDVRILTGTRVEIARLWRFFGVYYKRVPQGHPPDVDWLTHKPETFDVEHTDALSIVDPRGRWRVGLDGMPSTGGRLSPGLRALLNDEGRRNLRRPDQPWTPKQAVGDLLAIRHRYEAAHRD